MTSPGGFELVVREGPDPGKSLDLDEGDSAVVGRSSDCDFVLSDPGVSRRHCELEVRDGRLHFRDLDSANGTFLDGERQESGTIDDGQELLVGPVRLRCRAVAPEPEASPGPAELARADTEGGPAPGPGGSEEEFDPRQTRVSYREGGSETVVRKKVDTRAPLEAREEGPGVDQLGELKRAQQNLGTAYKVSKLLNRARDMDELFDGVIASVFDSVNADRAAVLLGEDGDEEELEVVAARQQEGGDGLGAPEEISLSRTVVRDVLENGVSTLSRDAGSDARFEDAQSVIAQHIQSVVCVPLATDEEILGVLYADSQSVASAFNETDLEMLALIGNQAGVAIHRARLMQELEEFFFDSIRAIVATIDAKDGYTHRHSERVAAFAVRIAREAGAEEEERDLETVRLSGLLHDIGKIGVPDVILNKPGDLTDEEFDEVKKHPVHGVEILGHIQNPRFEPILPGVRHHHEKWDGSGYPDGLSGREIPYLGRLLAVADVLDALSSNRAYRDAFTLDKTVGIIEEDAGSHFDPELAEAAVALHERGELDVPHGTSESPLEELGAAPG